MCCKLRIITACKMVWLKVYDGGFGSSRRACVNLRFKTQQVRRRTRLFMQAQNSVPNYRRVTASRARLGQASHT
jgi:hypothetical protein